MRWFFSTAVLLFGIITIDLESLKWSALGITLYSLPLLLQFTKREEFHIWALWGGIFLMIQSFLSPDLISNDFKTLQPNTHRILNVKSGIPGINGKQIITTDSKGFRTTKDIDYQNDKTYRIFAIGGSTTEQIYLDDHHTWTHLLQEHLSTTSKSEVEVINTGLSGLRAKHHLATLQNIIGQHPDLVLFLVGVNDWNLSIKEEFSEEISTLSMIADYRANLSLKKTLMGNFITLVTHSKKDTKKEENSTLVKDEYGAYYSKQRDSLSRQTVHSFYPKKVSTQYKEYMTEIGKTCHDNKIKCLFITQPTGYQKAANEAFKKGFWMTPPNQEYTLDFENMTEIAQLYNTFLTEYATRNNHYICDTAALTPTVDNFYDECHFNTQGAKNISVIIGQCINKINGEHPAY